MCRFIGKNKILLAEVTEEEAADRPGEITGEEDHVGQEHAHEGVDGIIEEDVREDEAGCRAVEEEVVVFDG